MSAPLDLLLQRLRTAPAAPGRLGDAASAAHRARATGGAHGRAADRPDATRALARAPRPQRHVEANEPGQLVCLDTFYIGDLKGIGKVWQITACDAATSYGLAGLLPAHDAAAAATFLREVVVPHFQRVAGAARAHRRRAGIQGRF